MSKGTEKKKKGKKTPGEFWKIEKKSGLMEGLYRGGKAGQTEGQVAVFKV